MFEHMDVDDLILAAQTDEAIVSIREKAKKQHSLCMKLFACSILAMGPLMFFRAELDTTLCLTLMAILFLSCLYSIYMTPMLGLATKLSKYPVYCKYANDMVAESEVVRSYRDLILSKNIEFTVAHYYHMRELYKEHSNSCECKKLHGIV